MLPIFSILIICMIFTLILQLRYYYKSLSDSTTSSHPTFMWKVQINGVTLGSIADNEYAKLRLKILSNSRTYIAQALNVGHMLMRALKMFLITTPILAFWLMFFLYIESPAIYADALATPPWELILFFSLSLVSLVLALSPKHFGFVNEFDKATTNQIKQQLNIVYQGTVSLVTHNDDGSTFIDLTN